MTGSMSDALDSGVRIASFKDPLLRTGAIVLHLLRAVSSANGMPNTVSLDLILPGATVTECKLNATYAISCAHKMGCRVFTTWEDVVNVKQRMILCLVCAVMEQDPAIRERHDSAEKSRKMT